PDNAYALSMLAHARAQRCAWSGIEELFASLQRLLETPREAGAWSVSPFPLHAMPLPPRLLLRAARDWARGFRRDAAPMRPAPRIRDDGIEVLFDLNGYTRNARTEIFALRPAPIQINSMGFPGTLGAEWYDYIHVDGFVVPPSEAKHFSERLLVMPASYVPSD